jgi:integrase
VPWTVGFHADKAFEAGKLPRLTLHEARHSFGSYCDAAGVSGTRSARYLGHSLPEVSDRYRHGLAGQLAADAKLLDKYLAAGRSGKVVAISTGANTCASEKRNVK